MNSPNDILPIPPIPGVDKGEEFTKKLEHYTTVKKRMDIEYETWIKQQQEKPTMQIEHFDHFKIKSKDNNRCAIVTNQIINVWKDLGTQGDPDFTIYVGQLDEVIELLTAVKANLRGE